MDWYLIWFLWIVTGVFGWAWLLVSHKIMFRIAKIRYDKKYSGDCERYIERSSQIVNNLKSELQKLESELQYLSKDRESRKKNNQLIWDKFHEVQNKKSELNMAESKLTNSKDNLDSVIMYCGNMDKLEWVSWLGFAPVAILFLVVLFYGIGWVWYYICGGWTLFHAESFFEVVAFGAISIVTLGFIIGFVAILFGWKPPK